MVGPFNRTYSSPILHYQVGFAVAIALAPAVSNEIAPATEHNHEYGSRQEFWRRADREGQGERETEMRLRLFGPRTLWRHQ